MTNSTVWLDRLLPLLESANFTVQHPSDDELLIFFEGHAAPLALRLNCLTPEVGPQLCDARVQIPLSLEIPEAQLLYAVQVMADFNRHAPLGQCNMSPEAQPYFDHQVQMPAHGEFYFNLLEMIQLSFLFAGRLMDFLQGKIREWVVVPTPQSLPQSA